MAGVLGAGAGEASSWDTSVPVSVPPCRRGCPTWLRSPVLVSSPGSWSLFPAWVPSPCPQLWSLVLVPSSSLQSLSAEPSGRAAHHAGAQQSVPQLPSSAPLQVQEQFTASKNNSTSIYYFIQFRSLTMGMGVPGPILPGTPLASRAGRTWWELMPESIHVWQRG